ncbi:MAG: prephenate dehydratase [Elusimicrobiota bacterium]|jgi:chorismate mutase/prephenate dehydratase|nr:prephenate dehydratase [Elusimicrobiota bacterium]
MTSKLTQIRKSIDKIDIEIAKLIGKRAGLALDVAKTKKTQNLDIYAPSREKEVLKNVVCACKGQLSEETIKNIYTEIISACRNLENPIKIAFLGPLSTFSHQAAIKNFGSTNFFVPVDTPQETIEEVECLRADFAVVPIENSNEGSVNATLDKLVESDLKICSEISLKIIQCFLVKPENSKILKIYSHPHAIAQCKKWIAKNYPDAELIPVSSTSQAAKKVSMESCSAAIASEAAAKIYKLKILQKGIQDSRENWTRFFVVGKISTNPSGNDKTSLVFTVKNKIGALYEILGIFNKNKVDLTKIESRPTKKKAWEYMFFVDFNGHIKDKNIAKTLESLGKFCVFVKSLGSYSKG